MHVLITGASKGIGLKIALKFASSMDANLRISMCARNARDIRDAAGRIGEKISESNVFAEPCDVSKEPEVTAFTQRAVGRFGAVDILINNAGFGTFKAAEEMTTQEFDDVLATNLRGVFLMTRAVLPSMIDRKSGSIVTISSLAGKNGFEGGTAYCASKFGVRGLMQSLFLEVRQHNIRVLTIFPGSVDTAFFDSVPSVKSVKPLNALEPEDVAEAVYLTMEEPARATISEMDIRPTNPKYSS